jgi:hypothetical protein
MKYYDPLKPPEPEEWRSHCLLWLPVWPTTERIEDGDPGGLEIRHVARHHREPVFQCRCRDHEVGAVIAESGAQGAPTPRRSEVKWYDPLAVKAQYPVQPDRKRASKAWIGRALSRNAALYFANAYDAEEKISRSLPFEPLHDHRISLPPAQLG